MDVRNPIITSMLDGDLYKINMGSVVFHLFPRAIVEYTFFNRGKTEFPKGFAEALISQVNLLANVALTDDEAEWLKKIPYMRPTYVEWLKGYRMNPKEVTITQVNGYLCIKIRGPWYRTIYWEVKLMAIISELYFIMTGQTPDTEWEQRIENKGVLLQTEGCHWIDFGTRRRFSKAVQEAVCRQMRMLNGFLGTSNPYFAFKYKLTPNGTYAHECVMAMSALYGVRMADKMWRKSWSEHFEGDVGVSLTDTFTTDFFLRQFDKYDAHLYDGLRQDSGVPYDWADNKVLPFYSRMRINPIGKRLVFSDSLGVAPKNELMAGKNYNYVRIDHTYRKVAQPVGGIGTNFTNDVGVKPLNMVIKLTAADFGQGMVNVVKLSDDKGKHTGDANAIARALQEIGA